MFNQDDFLGAKSVPWPLLIRARYTFEIDALIASTVVRAVSTVASQELTEKVAEAARAGVAASERGVLAGAEQRVGFLDAAADWDDGGICPPWWPWHGPRPHYVDDLSDPITAVVLASAAELVSKGGSAALQASLGRAVAEGASL
jgi:hypothetical protein